MRAAIALGDGARSRLGLGQGHAQFLLAKEQRRGDVRQLADLIKWGF